MGPLYVPLMGGGRGASVYLDFLYRAFEVSGFRTSNLADVPGVSISRSSVGYAERNDGTLQLFQANEARITDKGLLVEEARTNLIPYSTPTSGQWATSISGTGVAPTVTYNFATAPDGSQTAARVQLDKGSGNTSSDFAQFFSPSTAAVLNGNHVSTLWLKTNDGSSKVVTLRDGGPSPVQVTVTGTWQRFSVANNFAGTVGQVGPRLRGTESTAQTADLLVWGGQIEAGTFATSLIPTTSSSATRGADSVSVGGPGTALTAPFTARVWWSIPNIDGVDSRALSINDGSALNRTEILRNTSNSGTSFTVAANVTQTAPAAFGSKSGARRLKAAIRRRSGEAADVFDGATPTTGSQTLPSNISTIYLGRGTAGIYANGYIELVTLQGDTTDAALQALTA